MKQDGTVAALVMAMTSTHELRRSAFSFLQPKGNLPSAVSGDTLDPVQKFLIRRNL